MKKLLLSLAAAVAILSGCATTQTTNAGAVGVQRKQFMMLSEKQVDQMAAQSYLQTLKEAAYQADTAGDDPIRLRTYNELTFLLGFRLSRFEEADIFSHLGEATLRRAGIEGEESARWYHCRAILAFTPVPETYRRLAFLWGVRSHLVPYVHDLEDMLQHVDAVLSSAVKPGDQVVLICGYPVGAQRPPNMALLHTVGSNQTVMGLKRIQL